MENDERLVGLKAHYDALADRSLRDLFAADPDRFYALSVKLDDLLLDFSKCRITTDTLDLLEAHCEAAQLPERTRAMFNGQAVNTTENRPALHIALRNFRPDPIIVNGRDVMSDIRQTYARVVVLAEDVRSGALRSATGNPFTDVVNLGIGGSDLGPALVTAALKPYHDGPRLHFVSNIDGAHLADTLAGLSPETTLFIVASKSFTTQETMTNAASAKRWLAAALGIPAIGQHFVALSTAIEKVEAFGIDKERTFGFWDWVGGRYSVWSAIGLGVMLAVGPAHFEAFLKGAHALDENFRTAPFRQNLAVLHGAIGFWHRVICGFPSRAIAPYDQRLALFPAHLQQVDMESNGKSVAMDGRQLKTPSGPIVFGAPGTNGQHAYFQYLHQGTDIVPVEFLIAGEGHEPDLAHHHRALIANCLAQSEALAFGRTREEAEAELADQGAEPATIAKLGPHKVFGGNRPSTTIAYARLDPFTMGRLLALYEHRVFVESVLYGNNAFDQWGVELGKTLASQIEGAMGSAKQAQAMNVSTQGLLRHLGCF